jgi:hypothetical protein
VLCIFYLHFLPRFFCIFFCFACCFAAALGKAKKKVSQVFYESWDTFFVSNVVTFKFLKFLKKEKSIHEFFLFLAFFFLVFLFFPAFFLHFFALQKKGSAPAKKNGLLRLAPRRAKPFFPLEKWSN